VATYVLKLLAVKKRRDACQHLAVVGFTPETVGELKFGEI